MQRKLTLWLIVLTLGLGAAAMAADQENNDRPRRGDGPGARGPASFLRHVLGQLDLTEEQRASIKSMVNEHREAAKTWRQEHKDELEPLIQKLRQAREDRDREAAREAILELRELHKTGPSPQELLEKIKGQLTEQQNAELQKMVEEARRRMAERRGEGDRPTRRGQREQRDD